MSKSEVVRKYFKNLEELRNGMPPTSERNGFRLFELVKHVFVHDWSNCLPLSDSIAMIFF